MENDLINNAGEPGQQRNLEGEPLQNIVANNLKPKKRSRNGNGWKQNIIKKAKAQGLPHRRHSSANVLVPARQIRIEECTHRCQDKVSLEEKQFIFQRFNTMANHQIQNVYLQGCTTPLENNRFQYTLHLTNRVETVRQKQFVAIHGIRRSRLQRKVLKRNLPIQDGRGRHENHKKLSEPSILIVRTFIENLDARESHYSRVCNKNKKFLDSNTTLKSLYSKFLEKHPGLSPDAPGESVLLWKFVRIFNYEFNVGFGYPRSDVCETCEKFKAAIRFAVVDEDEEKQLELSLQQQEHWSDSEIFTKKMSKDVIGQTDDTHTYLCFDYQKNLPFPVTNVGKEFFLRQMWLHNFGIRNIGNGETHLFTYCEHYARKGSSEVISCIKYYIENVVPMHIRHLHLFCDNSSGQNKHRFLFAYLHSLCPGRFDSISLDFPLPGHSRMTIDGDFAHIEQLKKKEDKIEYPSQWIALMRKARVQTPFHIVYINHPVTDDLCGDNTPIVSVQDFKTSLTPLLSPASGRIFQLKGLVYSNRGVFSRETMAGPTIKPFVILRRNISVANLQEVIRNAPNAYTDFLPITPQKYENIQTLLPNFYRPGEKIFYDVINMRPLEDTEIDI